MARGIGTLSLAITLIAAGLVWLAGNLGLISVGAVARWWPLLIVLLGLEMLLARGRTPAGARRPTNSLAIVIIAFASLFFASVASQSTDIGLGGGPQELPVAPGQERVFTLNEDVSTLHVNSTAFDVEILPADGEAARGAAPADPGDRSVTMIMVRGDGTGSKPLTTKFRQGGKSATIEIVHTPSGRWFFAESRGQVILYVPEHLEIIHINGRAGRVRAADINASMEVTHYTGSVHLKNIAGNVTVSNHVGAITIEDIPPTGEAPAPAGTPPRRVSVKNSVGEIVLRTSGPLRGPYAAESSVGSVSMHMHDPGDIAVRGRSQLGSVKFRGTAGFQQSGGVSTDEFMEWGAGTEKVPVTLKSSVGEVSVNVTK